LKYAGPLVLISLTVFFILKVVLGNYFSGIIG